MNLLRPMPATRPLARAALALLLCAATVAVWLQPASAQTPGPAVVPSAQASPCDGLMGGMHLGKHAGVCPGMYMSALRVCVSRWCLLSPGGCVPVGRFSLSGTLFSRSRSTLSLSHSTGRAAARTLNDTAGTVRLQIIICQTPHQGKDRTSCTTAPSIGRWALHSGSRPLLRQGRR